MPNLTPRLGLKKPLPTEVADISVLNENLDKIDELAKASSIKLADVDNLFTATDVEGGMKELFMYADSGKKLISSVIGSPATATDSFAQLAQKIQDAKNLLASNLVSKGQSATGSESIAILAGKVANISTNHKVVTGSFSGMNGNPFPPVTGIPGRPKLVWVERYLVGADVRGPAIESPTYGFSAWPMVSITDDGFTIHPDFRIAYPGANWTVLY
jgi:hypothetical protein